MRPAAIALSLLLVASLHALAQESGTGPPAATAIPPAQARPALRTTSTIPLSKVLEMPVTPASTALLALHLGKPIVTQRLKTALGHADPAIRAVAARVANVSADISLVEPVRAAIGSEQNIPAFMEQLWALVNLDPQISDQEVIEKARLHPDAALQIVPELLARARGPAAIEASRHWPADFSWNDQLGDFLLVASRGDLRNLDLVARRALDERDSRKWWSAEAATHRTASLLPQDTLARALRSPDRQISAEVAWHLALNHFRPTPQDCKEWIDSIAEGEAQAREAPVPEDPDDAFGRVILRRFLGQAPSDDTAWMARLEESRAVRADIDGVWQQLLEHLTKQERRRLEDRARRLRPGEKAHYRAPNTRKGPALGIDLLNSMVSIRTISRMPAGLLDSLKAEFTPVFLDKAPLLSGHVRRDAVGRPIAVKESEAWVERADADALRAILALSMPAQGQVLTSGAEEELALLKDATFMRSASKPWWIPIQGIDASADSVSMPKRVKFVAPHYPTKARDARHEGSVAFDIVVDQLGDVSEIRVRTASDRSFVNAALMAVMQWKYTPAKVSGTPVDMFMTVIVSFDLG